MKKIFLFAGAAVFALLPLTGCSRNVNPLDSALKSIEAENWQEADIASQKAVDEMPDNVNALIIRALVCEKLDRYDQAVEHALKAYKTDNQGFITLYTLGRLYASDYRRRSEAVDLLFKANRLRPENAETLILLANLHPAGKKLPYLNALQQLPEYRDSLELRFESAMDRVYRRDRSGVEEEFLKLFNLGGYNPNLIYAISGYFYICGNERTRQVAVAGYRRYLKFPESQRDARRTEVAKSRLPAKR